MLKASVFPRAEDAKKKENEEGKYVHQCLQCGRDNSSRRLACLCLSWALAEWCCEMAGLGSFPPPCQCALMSEHQLAEVRMGWGC